MSATSFPPPRPREAGFRPCLRCRPEASPGTPAWLGASATVSRALKLIGGKRARRRRCRNIWPERLGIGSRHLRRLFLRYLGATPVAVAQTRRVHFAKKLIDETRLPMTQIAMAAGFGSIRRFNATFQNLYGRTPRELRLANERGRERSRSRAHYTFRLGYRPPYDWDSLVEFLADARHSRRRDGDAGAVSPDAFPWMAAREASRSRRLQDRNYLELQIRYPDPAALFRIVERVRRIFDVGADPAEVGAHLKQDARLKPVVRAHPGLRVPGCWDGFEMSVRAILGQQVSVKGASTMAGRVAAEFGYRRSRNGVLFPAGRSVLPRRI